MILIMNINLNTLKQLEVRQHHHICDLVTEFVICQCSYSQGKMLNCNCELLFSLIYLVDCTIVVTYEMLGYGLTEYFIIQLPMINIFLNEVYKYKSN